MQQEGASHMLAGKMACFEPLGLIKMTWRPRFLAENDQLWYRTNKQTNKTNPHPEPPAAKTITRKSIYTCTASYSFNESINDNICLAGQGHNSIVHFYLTEATLPVHSKDVTKTAQEISDRPVDTQDFIKMP